MDDTELPASSPEADAAAETFLARRNGELLEQYRQLTQRAQGHFAAVKGAVGMHSMEAWREMSLKADRDYESGEFLMERMGANRYLDPELIAVLGKLRAELLNSMPRPSALDKMTVDSAIVAYRNMLRFQALIDSICLQIERGLFGGETLNEIHGVEAGHRLEEQLRRLETQILPLLDRCQRMLLRAFSRLDGGRSALKNNVNVGVAAQVVFG